MPIPARSTASGADVPAPSPETLNPMISGMMKAALNTGPMKPTDCASTSISVSFFSPSRSYPTAPLLPSIATPVPPPQPRSDPRTLLPHASRWNHAAQPVSGRSNHTCTCPVPTEASYSLNSAPGAVHERPPSADAIIR